MAVPVERRITTMTSLTVLIVVLCATAVVLAFSALGAVFAKKHWWPVLFVPAVGLALTAAVIHITASLTGVYE